VINKKNVVTGRPTINQGKKNITSKKHQASVPFNTSNAKSFALEAFSTANVLFQKVPVD